MTKITKTRTIGGKGALAGKEMAETFELNGTEYNIFALSKDPSKLPFDPAQLNLTKGQAADFGLLRNAFRWKANSIAKMAKLKGFTEKDRKPFLDGWNSHLVAMEDAFAMVKAGGTKRKAAPKAKPTVDVTDREAEILAILRDNPALADAIAGMKA